MECLAHKRGKEEGGRKKEHFGNHVFDSDSIFASCPMRSDASATVFHGAAAPSAPPPLDGAPTPVLRLDACTGLSEMQALYSYYGAAAEAAAHTCPPPCTCDRRHRQLVVERGRPRGRPRAKEEGEAGAEDRKALAGMPVRWCAWVITAWH